MVQFLIFGDSITYGAWDIKGGWAGRLKEYVTKKTIESQYYGIVHNLGISGDTSSDVLERFEFETKWRLKEEESTVIIFEVGANDAILDEDGILRNTPGIFKKNIEDLIKAAKKYSSSIIFMGLLPVDETKTNPVVWDSNVYYQNGYLREYNDIIALLCQRHLKTNFVNNFETWLRLDYTKLLADGVHPNSRGHTKIFKEIKNKQLL